VSRRSVLRVVRAKVKVESRLQKLVWWRGMQQDGGIWLIDDRSTFQITLTPALSRGTGRGGRKGSGPHRQRPDPRRAGRARHGERQWRIRWNGNELHDRCAVHGAKKCRAAARWRGRDKARRHEGTEAQRHGGTEGKGRKDLLGQAEMEDGGIWLVDDRSTFQITLTPALSRSTGRGGRKGSGPQLPAIPPRRFTVDC
jgi:hypothetical protein